MPTPFDYKLYFQEDEDDFGGEREYWDSGYGAAGCIFIAKDTGRILLAHRSDRVDFEPHTWGTWGGKVDEGETPNDAVVREVEEETGYDGEYKVHFLWTFEDHSAGFQYHNYLIIVPNEFTPQLNWENNNSEWVEYGEWPRPMHFGLKALIKNAGEKLRRVITLIKRKKADILEDMDTPPSAVQHAAHPAPNYNITNAYIIAATLWGEARGEGDKGMQAVMNVIMNRAKGDFKKARDIVLAPKQFSMWNKVHDPEDTALKFAKLYHEDTVYKKIIGIVDRAMKGTLPDITGGATFYFNPKKANPSWAKSMTKTATIGNHDFYKPLSKRTMKKGKVPSVIREMIESQNPNDAVVFKKGIVGDGIWAYELRSPKSYIRYRYEPDTKTFYLDIIATPIQQEQNKGYATALLETFFQLVKGYGGALDTESYTTSGMVKVKHVVERFAKQYGVRLVRGKIDESLISEAKFDFSVEGKDIPPEEVKKAVQLLYRYFKERDTLPWLLSHKWFLKEVRTGHSWIDGERYRFDYIARKGKEVDREPYPDAGYTKKMKVFRTPKDVIDYLETKEKKYEGKYAFRGMNMAEWVSAKKQGYIKSNAAYNLGNVSLTYFGSEFGTAHSYAGGFAPFDKEPTRSKPGVVVAVPFELTQDAKTAVGMGTQGERVAEKIPIDQVKGVWYIVPIQAGRGYFELVLKDGNLDRGSAAPPFSKYVLVSKMELEPNKITESIVRGREFPMTVYHGGSMTAKKPVVFVTRHLPVAQSYAKDRKGKIHTFTLDIKRPAGNIEVDAVAKKLGIRGSIGDDSPSYEYLSPDMIGHDKVNAMVRELSKQGFDSAWIDGDFSMEDSFTEYDSFVVWNQSVLKPVTALTEETLRTLHGSVIARHKNNVGKRVGNQIYVHRDYAPEVIPQAVLQRAQQVLDKAYPGFAYNCMVYDAVKGIVRFDESPDFNSAREPHVGDFVTIFPDGTLPPVKGHSNSIWHHKWLWVKDDYKGFDVDKSKEWSKLWLSKLEGPAKGTDATWKMQLRNVDLLTEEFKDWADRPWIHYSDVDYLSIRDAKDSQSSIAGDPLGIYMFPEKATENLRYPYFERMKYKMYIQVTKKLNILDLSHVTKDIIEDFGVNVEQLKQIVHYPDNLIANKTPVPVPTAFWTILRRRIDSSDKFRKLLMSKGYDAVFDDSGAIYSKNEVQLCVFDPSNLKILKIEPQNSSKSAVDESQDDGVYLGALDSGGSNMQPVYSDDQLTNHPSHMKATDRRWRYYPDLKQLDWQGQPTPEEHEGTKEFLAQRGMPVVRVHYLAGSTKKENMLLMEAITDEQAKAAIEFLKKMVAEGPFKGQVYLAGGPVRDMIMGKTPKDLDLSVVSNTIWGALKFTSWLANQMGNYKGPSGPPPKFHSSIEVDSYGRPTDAAWESTYDSYYAQYSNPVIFPKFGTAKLNLTGMFNGVDLTGVEVEAVSARKEVYEPGNRKPIQVLPGTLEDDVFRRDFRCNSLMLNLTTGQTHDLSGKGIEDIKNRVLVTTSNPEMIFREDPLRMMRAVRFMVQKGFQIAPETEANIKKNASWLKFISRERVRDEIDKILVTKDPGAAFRKMDELGLLQYVSPEIKQMIGMTQNVHHEHDVFDHTMAVLANTNPELVRRRMALFHDVGKLVTREVTPTGVHFIGHEMEGPAVAEKIMMDLKYPKMDIDAVKLGITHHMKLKHGGDDAVKLSDKSLRKFKIAVGQYLEHILDVIHADNTAHASASAMPNQIAAVRKRLDTLDIKKVDKPTLPITGDDLIAIGIKPGPVMGKILSADTDAWYENPQITKDQAMQIAHQTYGKA